MREYNTRIQLNVRVKDIKAYHFFTKAECPISLALERAGFANLKDKGLGLVDEITKEYYRPREINGYTRLQKTMTDTYKKLDMRDIVEYPIKATLKINL